MTYVRHNVTCLRHYWLILTATTIFSRIDVCVCTVCYLVSISGQTIRVRETCARIYSHPVRYGGDESESHPT